MDKVVDGKTLVPLDWRGIYLRIGSPDLIALYRAKASKLQTTLYVKRVMQGQDSLYRLIAIFYDCHLQREYMLAKAILHRARRRWPAINWDNVIKMSFDVLADKEAHKPGWQEKSLQKLRKWVQQQE